jgi:hypothetical protein
VANGSASGQRLSAPPGARQFSGTLALFRVAQVDLVTANSVPCNGSAVASFVVLSRLLEQAHPK